jgi:hypothetical protein
MKNVINYVLTPWDEKSLGYKTAEIQINEYSDYDSFEYNFKKTEKDLVNLGVEFIYIRISSSDLDLRSLIQKVGFYFVESSLELYLNNVSKYKKKILPKLSYQIVEENDLESIKNIASDSFNYGRFHEDKNIPLVKSQLRYYNWIDDLVKQGAEIYIAKVGNIIVGFNIQKTNSANKTSTLILAGCKIGSEIFGMSLWNEIIESNRARGINKISALISSSNLGVFNIYLTFDFKVRSCYFGFHKKIRVKTT